MMGSQQHGSLVLVKIKVHARPRGDEVADIDKLIDNAEELSYRVTMDTALDDVFLRALRECGVTPIYASMFGLRRADSHHWFNLGTSVEQHVDGEGDGVVGAELRVRFAFRSESTTPDGTVQYAQRHHAEGEGNGGKHVMNETVIRYYFYQRRFDFIEGRFHSPDVDDTKEISPQLGVAVLDMVRIARELGWSLQRVQNRVKFKRLLPVNIRQSIRSHGFMFKKKVRMQFAHYLRHFRHVFDEYLDDARYSVAFIYGKYLRNLELVPGCEHRETYHFYLDEESAPVTRRLALNGDIGVVEVTEGAGNGVNHHHHNNQHNNSSNLQETRRQLFDFSHLADMAVIKRYRRSNSTQQVYCVSLSLLKGGVVELMFEEEEAATSFATCVDGYYRLLVDSHYYLCAELTPPHLLRLLKLSCHGPIAFCFAEGILKTQPLVRVGDCLLRQSLESFDEFFINAVVETEPQVVVKNYKLDRNEQGLLGIFGDASSHEYRGLDSLLKNCRNGVHDPLPFQLQHIIPPQVHQTSNLVVTRSGDESSMTSSSRGVISSVLLGIRDYNIVSYLGRGRFTEVKLYRSHLQRDKLVVIKETMYKSLPNNQAAVDFKQKQCVDDSFERSRNLLSKISTSHIVQLIGTIKNMVVVQHVAMGSITMFLRIRGQKALEDYDEPWFTTVIWQLAHACTYLEERKLAHGNICGKNVLLMKAYPQPHIKLSDPGVTICARSNHVTTSSASTARYKEAGSKYEACLHPPWLAYEFCAVTGRPQVMVSNATYPSTSGDRWSFATTVYEICHLGKHISWSDSAHHFTADMQRKYTTANIIQPHCNLLAGGKYVELHELLRQCWNVYPPKRPPFRLILRELRSIITQEDYPFEVDGDLSEKQKAEFDQPKLLTLDTYYEDSLVLIKELGKGHFGQVDLFSYQYGHEHDVTLVAIKQLRDTTQWSGDEIETMRSLDHEFVVRLKGITQPNEMIVLEYLPEGNLHDWIIKHKNMHNRNPIMHPLRKLTVEFLKFSEQIAEGMVYLQDAKILHRDLALRNILLAKDQLSNALHIKISDFGLSRLLPEHENYYKGNPEQFPALWYAPECLNMQKKVYKRESDVWSYGVLVWEMYSYCAPPRYPDVKSLDFNQLHNFHLKLRAGLRLPRPLDCPDPVYQLMLKCWTFEPGDRVTFRVLQHKFNELRGSSLVNLSS